MSDETRASSAAARFWARHELGSRWRSLVVLGLLAGIAGGVATAAFAGARRTETAYARYRVATSSPNAVIFGTQVGDEEADYRAVEQLPAVTDSGTFNLAGITLKGYPRLATLAPGDAHLYRTLAKPLVEQGRLPDPHRADEVLVNREAAKKFHFTVGQRVTLISSSSLAAFYGQAPMRGGPTIRARVVGIGSGPMDLLFGPDEPSFIPSGELLRRFGRNGFEVPEGKIAKAANLVVRLRPGTDLVQFHHDVANALHLHDQDGAPVAGRDVPIRDIIEDNKRVEHATDLERTGLLLFAAAVALAGLMLVGQAITRVVFAIGDSTPTLRAMGFVRRELVSGTMLPMFVAAAVGAVVTVVVAVALSPQFPVGLAGQLDPDRGVHFDVLAVVLGTLVVALATMLVSVIAALRVTSRRPRASYGHGSRIVAAVRAVAPPSVSIGAGLALERGRGDRSLPVRLAIFAGVVAVVGVIGCLGLLQGINDALHEPVRSGQVWDAIAFPETPKQLDRAESVMHRDPAVTAIALEKRKTLNIGGNGLPLYGLDMLRGNREFTVLTGHAPSGTGEVLLGPSTAKALHRGVGDHITLTSGDERPVRMTVVGTALLPQEPHSSFDQGAWVTSAGFDRITGGYGPSDFTAGDVRVVAAFRPSANSPAVVERLGNTARLEVDPLTLPQDVLLLRNVRSLPKDLAVFLVLLGVAALGHALVTAVRRRRHDIAVLRALGFTPRQAAISIASQASAIGVISLLIGIPVGLVVGQLAWRWVAEVTPLLYVAPITLFAILLVIPITIVGANLLAAWPANRASRIRPADVLRSESPA